MKESSYIIFMPRLINKYYFDFGSLKKIYVLQPSARHPSVVFCVTIFASLLMQHIAFLPFRIIFKAVKTKKQRAAQPHKQKIPPQKTTPSYIYIIGRYGSKSKR